MNINKFTNQILFLTAITSSAFAVCKITPNDEARILKELSDYKPNAVCNGIAYYDLGSETDGPAYYVNQANNRLESISGGMSISYMVQVSETYLDTEGKQQVRSYSEYQNPCEPLVWSCPPPSTQRSRKKLF
jgi:hypothetical protein